MPEHISNYSSASFAFTSLLCSELDLETFSLKFILFLPNKTHSFSKQVPITRGYTETRCQVAISFHWWCRGLRLARNSWPQLVHLKRWHLSSSNSTCVVGRQAGLHLNTWCMAENVFESQMSKFQTTDLWGKCWSQKPKKKKGFKVPIQDSSLVQELPCVVRTFTRSQC